MSISHSDSIISNFNSQQDFYSKTTQKIISVLENGKLPWRVISSEKNSGSQSMRPLRSNGVPFSGINKILLAMSAMENDYQSPYWMTVRQASELDASISTDEQGTSVVFADKVSIEEPVKERVVKKYDATLLKEYIVYNAKQIEGLQEFYYKNSGEVNKKIYTENLDKFIAETKAKIQPGSVAAYDAATDTIIMPPERDFSSQDAYYHTLFSELILWTQHETRLNRGFKKERNGDHVLAKEALVAELGSCFLAAELGFESSPGAVSPAFLQSWLNILQHDNRFFFMAASQAHKAVEYLMNLQPTQQPKPRSVAAEPKPGTKIKPAF